MKLKIFLQGLDTMQNKNNEISTLTLKKLLSNDDWYQIPVYQRNYAWEEREIEQLVQDIIDNIQTEATYFLGNLIVFPRIDNQRKILEVVDGQQRLTTLVLLTCYLNNQHAQPIDMSWFSRINLGFECRESSDTLLHDIFQNNSIKIENHDHAITRGYSLAQRAIETKTREYSCSLPEFASYLFNHVSLIRIPLPEQTHLNHYFEVMNNRGEQLEKHEILKAQLMSDLHNKQDKLCFKAIWEACSDMDRYVQMGISSKLRAAVFGENWNEFTHDSFDTLVASFYEDNRESESQVARPLLFKMSSLTKTYQGFSDSDDKEKNASERFNSPVNFSNFLMIVLRICTKNMQIPLDDKKMIDNFNTERKKDLACFSKRFAFTLLKTRFLLDQYVIKREYLNGVDYWSLKKIKVSSSGDQKKPYYANTFGEEEEINGVNREILQLLSMFHVSFPAPSYKYWLYAALRYLNSIPECKITPEDYQQNLQDLARSFVFDRYLAVLKKDYNEIIDKQDYRHVNMEINPAGLRYEAIENNLVFNYVDYLLWSQNPSDPIKSGFYFTFRSSIEHLYPQNPKNGQLRLDDSSLHSFGNLCLMSRSQNSSLGNHSPLAKIADNPDLGKTNLKLSRMAELMKQGGKWTRDTILEHEKEMQELLIAASER